MARIATESTTCGLVFRAAGERPVSAAFIGAQVVLGVLRVREGTSFDADLDIETARIPVLTHTRLTLKASRSNSDAVLRAIAIPLFAANRKA